MCAEPIHRITGFKATVVDDGFFGCDDKHSEEDSSGAYCTDRTAT